MLWILCVNLIFTNVALNAKRNLFKSEDQQRLCCRGGKAKEDGEKRMCVESGMFRAKGLGREKKWRCGEPTRLRWDLNPQSFN